MSDIVSVKKIINNFNKTSLLTFRQLLSDSINNEDSAIQEYIINKLSLSKDIKLKKEIVHAIELNPKAAYLQILLELLNRETDGGLVTILCKTLIKMDSKDAIEGMKQAAATRTTTSAIKTIESHLQKMSSTEPVEYYINDIFKGSRDAKASLHAVNVLLRLGSEKIIDTVFNRLLDTYDLMARDNALAVLSGFQVQDNHLEALVEFLGENIRKYDKYLSASEIVDTLLSEDKDKVMSTAINALRIFSDVEHVNRLIECLQNGSKNQALEFTHILLKSNEFFLTGLIPYIQCLLENRNTEAKQKISAFKGKLDINLKIQSSIVNRSFSVLSRSTYNSLLGFKTQFPDVISKALESSSLLINKGAGKLLGAVYHSDDEILLEKIKKIKVPEARFEFVKRLGERKDDEFYTVFLQFALDDETIDVSQQSVSSMAQLPIIKNKVKELIDSGNVPREILGIQIIREGMLSGFESFLKQFLTHRNEQVVVETIETIKHLKISEMYDDVLNLLNDSDSNKIKVKSIGALAILNPQIADVALFELFGLQKNPEVTVALIEALFDATMDNVLEEVGNIKKLMDALTKILDHKTYFNVAIGIGPLFNIKQKFYYEKLRELYEDKLSEIRRQPKWDKKILSELENAIKECNSKEMELDKAKEVEKNIKAYLGKLDESKDDKFKHFLSEIGDIILEYYSLIDQSLKKDIQDGLFHSLEKYSANWQIKRVILEVIGDVLTEKNFTRLKPYLTDASRAVRAEAKKALHKAGFEPEELSAFYIKKIFVGDNSKFFRNKICNYLKNSSTTLNKESLVVLTSDESPDVSDFDLAIVDQETFSKMSMLDKKFFKIVTILVNEPGKQDEYDKKGVQIIQKPFNMADMEKKIVSFFK